MSKRKPRGWKVLEISTGPEDNGEPEVVGQGTKEWCLDYYKRLREDTAHRAIVVVDGFNRPVYACS